MGGGPVFDTNGTVLGIDVATMTRAIPEPDGRETLVPNGVAIGSDVIRETVPANLDIGLDDISIDRQSVRMRVQAKNFESADRLGAELQKFAPFANTKIGSIETDARTGGKRFTATISLKRPEAR